MGAVTIVLLMTGCGQKGPLYRSEPVPDYVSSPASHADKKPSPFSRPSPQAQKKDRASSGTDTPDSDETPQTQPKPQPPGN